VRPALGFGAGIEQAVAVDDLVVFVLEQRKIKFAGKGLDLLQELLRLGVGVDADGENFRLFLFLRRKNGFQLPELKCAVGSPVTAVENQDDVFLAAVRAQRDAPPVHILKREVGRLIADFHALDVRRRQPGAVFRP
jgi:hypothetical protein